ncbi:MAG: carotenoid oxygenase family protein [Halioglobus sp.]
MTTLLTVALCLAAAFLVLRYLLLKPLLANLRARANAALDLASYNSTTDYAKTGYCPIHNELVNAQITVEGEIPADFSGLYLRNGTNSPFGRNDSRRHMFNGAGMIHQVRIENGKATYSNQYTQTPRFLAEKEAGRELYTEFGDVAGGGKPVMGKIALSAIERRTGLAPNIEDVENSAATTAIQFHNGELYALQETSLPFKLNTRVDDGKLYIDGTGEFESFGGRLDAPFTAHPKIDPVTGDWISYSTELKTGRIHYNVLSAGQLTQHTELMVAKPAMGFLHDCYVTEKFSIFPDLSLRFDGKGLMEDKASTFYFDPDYKMRFGVIKRDHQDGEAVQWFTTDKPGHIWHTINGWEEKRADGGTDIVLFAPVFHAYPSNVPIHSSEEPDAHLYKFRLNLDNGEVTEQRCLVEHFYERPSFNTDYIGKPNQFAYLLDEGRSGGIMGKGVMKYDLINEQDVKYFDYGDYRGGEALFVPRQNSSAEDDGYLIDILSLEEKSYLVIIDAASMEEVAKLHIPQRVPYGVHACWLDEIKISALGKS